ncbi:hypothetical protein [Nostoc sp.]
MNLLEGILYSQFSKDFISTIPAWVAATRGAAAYGVDLVCDRSVETKQNFLTTSPALFVSLNTQFSQLYYQ